MNRPTLDLVALRRLKWWEHGLRFLFGGAVTLGAGFVAQRFGPAVGGLFLAFPAILPAALTLVRAHDGSAKAADDARGAQLGAVGLVAFGVVVSVLAKSSAGAFVPLAAALAGWFLVAAGLWFARFGRLH